MVAALYRLIPRRQARHSWAGEDRLGGAVDGRLETAVLPSPFRRSVILSKAKNLPCVAGEILRCTQDDTLVGPTWRRYYRPEGFVCSSASEGLVASGDFERRLRLEWLIFGRSQFVIWLINS